MYVVQPSVVPIGYKLNYVYVLILSENYTLYHQGGTTISIWKIILVRGDMRGIVQNHTHFIDSLKVKYKQNLDEFCISNIVVFIIGKYKN